MKKYSLVIIALCVCNAFSFAQSNNTEFQFKKVRVVMPEKTNTDTTIADPAFFTFTNQYIGLKPDQLFDIDVSKIALEKDTVYTCYVHLYVTDTVTYRSRNAHRLANTYEFTTQQVIGGIVQLPFDFCKHDAFIIPSRNILLDIYVTNTSKTYKVLSRISLRPFRN